ncbi:Integrase-type DNA-binding superfamily protein [Perilla frutescens var. hirtella]|uniref:Integrase-type DNA-binding superfamily protein n=1 Tax=Perilla frutescens var. hirtella TaxID=608512 RepID=A0AAD4P3I1_PERFH|nr:Integrase-type DNA-binding superfamily protein [Perilla frutescens var. hirtella]
MLRIQHRHASVLPLKLPNLPLNLKGATYVEGSGPKLLDVVVDILDLLAIYMRSCKFTVRRELKAAMVSIRRRKLLGLCSGRNSFLAPVSPILEQGPTPQSADNGKPVSVHPLPWDYSHKPKEETSLETGPGSSNMSAASIASIQHFPEVKRRKRHRRKHVENQEPCIMRGVYFKNLKWQAAIKVDKKQIHLGTVGSQEEAARLYDRAAFMCGREPNFDISEEEKQELRKFNWDEFLAVTRSAITNKKSQRQSGSTGPRRKLQDNEWEGEQGRSGASASDEETLAP